MNKRTVIAYIFCSIILFNADMVLAHPGRTDSKGCHICKTNCAKWGLSSGEYHCHSGNTYTNSKGQTFDSGGNLISDSSTSNTNSSSSSTSNTNSSSSSTSNTNSSSSSTSNTNSSSSLTSNSNSNSSRSSTSNINSSSSSNNKTTAPKTIPKSSDNTLKSITIDGESIEISDQMNYKTKNEKINILVETNDSRATSNVDNHSLRVGMNIIDIKVTAENGDVKIYSLVVDREKLSDNTNVKIFVDDEEINFTLGKADVNVSSDTKNLNYKYKLEDKTSQVKVDGDKDLKSGENIVTFTVIAEDGTEVKYELEVNKYTKTDETMESILGLATMGGIGYGSFYFVKKRKKK